MQQYVTELSRYTVAILMVVFTICSLTSLHEKVRRCKAVYLLRICILFVMQFFMFLSAGLNSGLIEYIFFYIFVQVSLMIPIFLVPAIYEHIDKFLLGNMCMFLGIGLCIVSRLQFDKAVRQAIIILLALAISLFVPWVLCTMKVLSRLTVIYAVAGIILLAAVFIWGKETYGAKITFSLWGVTFQPSELVKILYVFFLSAALCHKITRKRILFVSVGAAMHVLILVLSKDLGNASIYFVCYLFMLFVASGNYRFLFIGAGCGVVAAGTAYALFEHIRARVYAWQNPWEYIDTKGYAITQSLFAIGNGGWVGTGLFGGKPTDIPFVEADFIFSAICEEMGIVVAICLIVLIFSSFLYMIIEVGKIREKFGGLLVYGISILYIFQTFLTVGGGINMIPLTGVTLPFISYGGSSLLSCMVMFFVVQGAHIQLLQKGEIPCDEKDGNVSRN